MSQFVSPPPGGPQNLGPTIDAVNWAFTLVATAAVGARIYAKTKLTHNIGWDDFWILVSIVRLSLAYWIQRPNSDRINVDIEPFLYSHLYSMCRERLWTTSILLGRPENVAGC